jgi:predicted RNase H-like nuclease (RuvC/YqgF family)
MNREELKALGLTDEQIDKVMAAHGKVVKSTKDKADKVEGLETQIEDYKKQIEDRDTQLEELKKVDAKGLQAKIDELQQQNESTKTEYEKKLDAQQKDFAIESALRDAKARDPKLAKNALDLDLVTFKDGKLVGLDEQLKSLQESHDYLFRKEEKPGAPHIVTPGNPNGGSGKPNPFSKEHWNLTEQGKLFKENPDLYKSMKAQAGK